MDRRNRLLVALMFAFLFLPVSSPGGEEGFYEGRRVEILTHAPPGGLYDLYSRLLARHMGKYIPGNPTVIVKNMPGGGGLIEANYVFHRAKRDGSTIGVLAAGVLQMEAVGMPGVQYKSRDFEWIGLLSRSAAVVVSHRDAPIQNIDQLLDRKRDPLIFGTTAPPSIIDLAPRGLNLVLEKVVGRPLFKLIPGYGGFAPLRTALERREIDGFSASWDAFPASAPHFLEPAPGKGLIHLIGYVGLIKDRELDDLGVPFISERVRDPRDRAVLDFLVAPTRTLGPVAAPPGVPGERLRVLREAFTKAVSDPEFQAEIQKLKVSVKSSSAEELESIVKSILETPPQVVDIARAIFKK